MLRISRFCLGLEVRNLGKMASILDPIIYSVSSYIVNIEVERFRHVLRRLCIRNPIQTIYANRMGGTFHNLDGFSFRVHQLLMRYNILNYKVN